MVAPIRVIVVDDEPPARARLLALIARQPDLEVVGIARDGRQAVDLITAEKPDLAFLDIQMPGLDGLGVVQEITAARMPVTIFVSAYDKYAIDAFEAHALDYLLKPFSDERFAAALDRLRAHLRSRSPEQLRDRLGAFMNASGGTPALTGYLERVVIRSSGRVTFLPVDDIDWIEAAGVYVNLHVGEKAYLYRSSVTSLLQRLDPRRFVRVHRSAAVQTDRIRELQPRSHGDYTLVLKTNRQLTLSRAYRGELESWLRQPL